MDLVVVRDKGITDGTGGAGAVNPIYLNTFKFLEDEILEDGKNKKPIAIRRIAEAIKGDKDGDKDEARRLRNRLQQEIFNRSHLICEAHKAKILANKAFYDFTFGVTSTVMSAVSAAVGGEALKTGLSTVSAIASSTRTAIDAEFYQDLLAVSIVREIDKMREKELKQIIKKQKYPIDDYTLSQAIHDAQIYHSKCSFYQGVVELTRDKKPEIKTKEDLTNEINALEEERKDLEKIVTDTSPTYSDTTKQAKQRQLNIINSQITSLTLQRMTAPGKMQAKTPPEPPPPPQ